MDDADSGEIDLSVFARSRTLEDLIVVAEREGINLWELEVGAVLMAMIEGCDDEQMPL